MPTGGVDLNNVEEWIKKGAVAVGTGSNLTAPAKTGDFDKVTELAKQYVEKVKEARK
jgi:2-dehydro-3-deoxyphosphogluconate aldolase/(4S)-4-hydroxy-2-oxoglutarate aldolase